jgi:hypothetical protein
VTYSVWMRGRQVGSTRFELSPEPNRKAGPFHPTEYGLTVLPGIVDMFPALLAFGDFCRREGIELDDESQESAALAMDTFGESAEGRRVLASAKVISELSVRDSTGRAVPWESLAISDSSTLAKLANERSPGTLSAQASKRAEIVTYLITMTVATTQTSRDQHRAIRPPKPSTTC